MQANRIFLMRHGHAVPAIEGIDAHRHLSEQGRAEVNSAAESLRDETFVIVSSPLVRAVQTAELVAQVVNYSGVIQTWPELLPEANPSLALARLQHTRLDTDTVFLLVCHEPIVSKLARLLGSTKRAFETAEILGLT